jgi:hypothetical protein
MPNSLFTKKKIPIRAKISVYEKRRMAMRDLYGINSEAYRKKSKTITKRLKAWRRSIRNIEQAEQLIKDIDLIVKEYIGVSARDTVRLKKNNEAFNAKQFLCRYCLDKKISGAYVRCYIGATGLSFPSRARMSLIRRCQHDANLNQQWKNFLEFIRENKIENAA